MTTSRNRVLPLALGLAAATTFVTYRFLKTAGQLTVPHQEPGAPVNVTVAVPKADIAPLQPLQASMFATRQVQAGSAPRGSVAEPAALAGKVSLSSLHA